MKLFLSPELFKKIPGLRVTAIMMKNLNNMRKNSTVAQLLRGACAEGKIKFMDKSKKETIMSLLERPAIEGLVFKEIRLLENSLKKIIKGREIKSTNNALDLAHYFSIKYLVPVFGHDLDDVEHHLEIKPVISLKAKKGPNIDITQKSSIIVLWFMDIGTADREVFASLPKKCIEVFKKYCNGEHAGTFELNADNAEIDLNYVSEKEKMHQSEINFEKRKISNGEHAPDLSKPFIRQLLEEGLNQALNTIGLHGDEKLLQEQKIEYPREKAHGDYATSVALKLATIQQKNPFEVAETIQKNFPKFPFLDHTEVVRPGFINFYLADAWLEKEVQKNLALKRHYGKTAYGGGQKVVIDYSSPNIAKPLGAHHLLSTLIGQTIANLLHFCGYKVVGVNYLGDWGTQFGKLIYAYKMWGDHQIIEKDPLHELLKLYTRFHEEAEIDPLLEEKSREEFKKMEASDEQNLHLWRWIREESIKALEGMYQKLGIHFHEYLGESMYEKSSLEIIEEGKKKGIFTLGEQGALIVQFEHEKYPPYLIQKADGTTLYSTRDLASIKDRLKKYRPKKLVYVVDVAQSLHFQQLFATAKKLGLNKGAELIHVVFGRMQFPHGKMSTRKGNMVLLEELLEEAVARAKKIVEEKSPHLPEAEKQFITEGIAIGAVKYHIVSQNRESNLVFDWDRMLALDGNSAPYLQYGYARAQSIIQKEPNFTLRQAHGAINKDQISLFNQENDKKNTGEQSSPAMEKALLHALVKFPEHVKLAAETYKPHLLTNYLFELAQIFNSFYQTVPVLNAASVEQKTSRLNLVKGFSQVIKNGLHLLGIQTFERM